MAFVNRRLARPGDPIDPNRIVPTAAPGAVDSPQEPGQVPDRSSVPAHGQVPVPVDPIGRRPLTEYGTAQRIMHVYAVESGQEDDPARFEQATASYEEMRKAYPALGMADSPAPGYMLSEGNRLASEALEVGGTSPAALDVESQTPGTPNEPANP
ncbi:MAG: hypothetical protein H0W06_09180 [Chloroflexia bacterium]|nr:hypothetical protein [Chloroflexia bacterium]